ncbi:hypothetical protein [Actinomycetospora straminea]|uniref:hypothetical protein n=1 Tax=Actinomycetospora straminea TaxID=663607 RepID=UPI00236675F4|nr:hypothetical protein [Actinomycetospora straminea]MDD7932934.1 hypothetical protein [Actinomycetospora straminea]
MSTPGGGAGRDFSAGRAAQERLTEEARATASALIDWLGTRVEAPRATPPAGAGSRRSRLGMRPPQSPGPCSWCPVCALVAALRGEQPELTARLAEQASGLMMLLRLMVQAHQEPGHTHAHHAPPPPGGAARRADDGPPPGWPREWGPWDGWGGIPPDGPEPSRADPPRGGRDREDGVPTDPAVPVAPASAAGPTPESPSVDEVGGGEHVAEHEAEHEAEHGAERADRPAGRGAGRVEREPGPPAGARGPRPRRPAAGGPPGGRRVPIRRASPRSATFRDATPGTAGSAASAEPAGSPGPAPTASPTSPVAGAPRPAAEPAAPPGPATTGSAARPSVQRIAIRRPARGREHGADGPGGDASC